MPCILVSLVALALLACSQVTPTIPSTAQPAHTLLPAEAQPLASPSHPGVTAVASATRATAATPVLEKQGTTEPQPLGAGEVRLQVVDGTRMAYLVNEQLARVTLPTDAVGVTESVDGFFIFGPDHTILTPRSRLAVDLRTLASDKARRDQFLGRRTLETKLYPFAVFIPRETRDLPLPLPVEGKFNFKLIGDLTIHGVSSEVVWDATATFAGDEIAGQATTEFPFDKFNLTPPRVRLVLSVEDRIRLRLDFRFKKTGG